MKKTLCRGLIAFSSLVALVSCQDYDGGFSNDLIKKAEYAKDFEKTFGTPDINQDWSMAAVISANVNIANAEGATLYILTAAPSSPDCRVLAQRVIDGSAISFNAVKGSSSVYALLTSSDGKSLFSGDCVILDGIVNIGNNSNTRATGGITIAGTEILSFGDYNKYGNWLASNHSNMTEEAWMAQQYEGGWLPQEYTGDAEPHTKVMIDDYNYKVCSEYNGKKYLIDAYHFNFTTKITLTYLDGKSVVDADSWIIKDNAGLFGPNMFFQEQLEYYSDTKAELYGETLAAKLSMLNAIEKGFTVTSTGEGNGEIHVPFIYGGTGNNNMLGYFYYPANQPMGDFTKYPHFILIDDANPGRNLKWSTGAGIGGQELSNLMAQTAMETLLEDERKVVGTDHTLAFFGENYDQAGTTKFPAGYNIVFFLAPGIRNAAYNGGGQTYNFTYALPDLNAQIGKMYTHSARNGGNVSSNGCTQGYDTDVKTSNGGAVKAVAWKYNGKVYMGFEDGGQDEDLNDLMFLIEGKFCTEDILTFYDIKWHLNTNPAIHTDDDLHSSEIGKMEGETYTQPLNPIDPTGQGREFLGWSLDPNATSGDMTIPESSRVTPNHDVCYFAIWEPSEDPTPTPVASWVIACEDLGGDFDYDFNDLVFAIRLNPIAGTNTANLELIPLAAGGTLEAHVLYNNNEVGEIHAMLGGGTNYSSIINASAGSSVNGGSPVVMASSIDANTDINGALAKISIVVKQKDGDASTNTYISTNGHPASATPQMMLLPGGWCWPSENNMITNVYESFSTWVQNSKTANWAIKANADYVTNLLP